MKNLFFVFSVFIMVSCKQGGEYSNPPKVIGDTQYYDSKIGIWYTIWWDAPGQPFYEHHWINETRVKPVEDGYYAADDPGKIKKDMEWFKKIGIDYILYDDTNHHYADKGNIADHIKAISDKIKEMGDTAPQFAFAAGAPLHKSKNPEMMQKEADIFYNYFMTFPDQYFIWKEKPLLVLFTSPKYYGWNDKGNRFTKRLASGHTSEGIAVADQHNLYQDGMYGWVFDHQYTGSEVYGITPGFSRSHNGMVKFKEPISRENGQRYVNQWLEAIKANPRMIVISSWNDHAEETGIEAVWLLEPIEGRENEQPFFYQEVTQGYLALKTGFLPQWYYREETGDIIYQFRDGNLKKVEEVPEDKVVIVIPDDYIDWSGVKIK